jgi:biopolymer transport protein ExbB
MTTTLRWLVAFAWCVLLAPGTAQAWWNADWTSRTRITIDTSAKGLGLAEAVNTPLIALRLHSGNFDFATAKPDGSDIRVLAADDKTPLPFVIERFDTVNELALVWVKPASVLPGTDQNVLHVYAGNAKAAAENAAPVFGEPLRFVAHFSESGGPALNTIGGAASAEAAAREANGLLAGSLQAAAAPLTWPASEGLKWPAGGAFSALLWVKPQAVDAGKLLAIGALSLAIEQGAVVASFGGAPLRGGTVAADSWSHVALSVAGGTARLFVNGAQVGEAAAALSAIEGPLTLAEGLRGLLDEVQLSAQPMGIAAVKLAAASQGADNAFIKATKDSGGEESDGGNTSYMGVLVGNLTTDAWVVIAILGVMFVVAAWVMVEKTVAVLRIDRGNQQFLHRFRDESHDAFDGADLTTAATESSLERLHRTGVKELNKRRNGSAEALSGASFSAVKAVLDADLVRESHSLNARMVLLTIAISGGPFLGLLGTVVGVMITFAAIAAAGDVNVNAIAPGIAAALLATVAGLAVAIPALFGYNWLASRIKNISADMQIFVDEFVTRAAETFGQR